jgi:hypothetical protein
MHMMMMVVVVMVMMMVVMHRRRRGLSRVFGKGGRGAERDCQHGCENKLLHRVEFPIYPQERGSQGNCKIEDESNMNTRLISSMVAPD